MVISASNFRPSLLICRERLLMSWIELPGRFWRSWKMLETRSSEELITNQAITEKLHGSIFAKPVFVTSEPFLRQMLVLMGYESRSLELLQNASTRKVIYSYCYTRRLLSINDLHILLEGIFLFWPSKFGAVELSWRQDVYRIHMLFNFQPC